MYHQGPEPIVCQDGSELGVPTEGQVSVAKFGVAVVSRQFCCGIWSVDP